jgi:DNA-3-methyladenine glycosylase II
VSASVQATVATIPVYWPRAKRSLARRDAVMRGIMRCHPRIALRTRGDAFQTLARAIVGQQISVKAADSVWSKLALVSSTMRAAEIAQARHEHLLAAGLSQRKAEYLHDLAQRFCAGALHPARWAEMDDESIVDELTRVRGIGRWTAEMFLMFHLLRPDVLPLDDLGLRKAVYIHYGGGDHVPNDAIRILARDWAPWRSVATWYLWRSLDPVPVEY